MWMTDWLLFYLSSFLPHLNHLAIERHDEEFSDQTLTAFRKLTQLRSLEVLCLASFGTLTSFTNLTTLKADCCAPSGAEDYVHFPPIPDSLRILRVDELNTCCFNGMCESSPPNNITHLEYAYAHFECVIPYLPKLESVVLSVLPRRAVYYPNEHIRSITVTERVDQQQLDLLCDSPQLQRSLTSLSFNVNQFTYGLESLRELSKLGRLTKLAMGCQDKVVDGPMEPMKSVLEVAFSIGVVAEWEEGAKERDRKVAAEWFPCAQFRWVRIPFDLRE